MSILNTIKKAPRPFLKERLHLIPTSDSVTLGITVQYDANIIHL